MSNNISPIKNNKKQTIQLIIASFLSIVSFSVFLVITGIAYNAIIMILMSIFFIYPFRKKYKVANNIFLFILIIFIGWILFGIGTQLIPFILAILIGYLLDPLATKLEKRGLKRWLSAAIVVSISSVIFIIGVIYIIPIIIEQTQTILINITSYVEEFSYYLQSKEFDTLLKKLNIPKNTFRLVITQEILPRLETILSAIFNSLISLFSSISNITNYIISIVILPILVFYFLKDFGKFKSKAKWILKEENQTIHYYVKRFDIVFRTYIGWIITTSTIVFVVSSISFYIFNIPYSILLAIIAGILNLIPYFGSLFSIIINVIILIFVNDANLVIQILILVSTILGTHFLNAYLLEPTIAGNKVGLHPVLMILAVFIFLSLFGIIGMLIAVPITSIIVLIIKEKLKERFNKKVIESINNEENIKSNEENVKDNEINIQKTDNI